jgi:4-hydroxy-3-polyprenylbenzoate decarboxylase
MAYKDLNQFITLLDQQGELARIKTAVSPVLEMAEIADRLVKAGGKAVLFENTGTEFPVLMNAMATEKRMCLALGVEKLDDVGDAIENLFKTITTPRTGFFDKLRLLPSLKQAASWFPGHSSGKGKCQEVVMDNPDLSKLPILQTWPHDGGKFITLPVVHTSDPVTGGRNVGMYRMQVYDNQTTGMHWHMHKNSARHYHEWKATGKRMPVTVTLGGDPVYTYSATAPLPDNVDEYLLAGFLRKRKVELVKCLTNELEVPSDVDFVIEGYVDPQEDLRIEGPFGDHTGFYSLKDQYPVFHVTCITHRKDAVFPATLVGIPPQEDLYIGKATERIFLQPIRMTMLPEVIDMHMPAEGVFHNIVFVKIKPAFPGHAARVMNALWGAGQMMFNKVLIVFSKEIDLTNYAEVMKALSNRVRVPEDVLLGRGPLDVLDHASAEFAYGGKLGLDATRKTVIGADWKNTVQIIPVQKTQAGQVRAEAEKWMQTGNSEVRFLVFAEHFLEDDDYFSLVWRIANNIDPARDCYFIHQSNRTLLVIDGTRKYAETDGFNRPWPNCTVMDDQTIAKVDQMWSELGLGPLLNSPSLRFRSQLYPGGAEAI